MESYDTNSEGEEKKRRERMRKVRVGGRERGRKKERKRERTKKSSFKVLACGEAINTMFIGIVMVHLSGRRREKEAFFGNQLL